MCSSGGSVAANDKTLQAANVAANTNFLNAARSAFAGQQSIVAKQVAKANYMMANPMGYTPQELKIQSANINNNFARAAKNALGSAAAFGAAHGAADVGGGPVGEMAGEIGTAAASGAASARASLAQQNEEMKRQNMLAGLSELNQAGVGAEGGVNSAISGAGETGRTTTEAGTGVTAAQQAGWQNLAGTLSGVGSVIGASLEPFKK